MTSSLARLCFCLSAAAIPSCGGSRGSDPATEAAGNALPEQGQVVAAPAPTAPARDPFERGSTAAIEVSLEDAMIHQQTPWLFVEFRGSELEVQGPAKVIAVLTAKDGAHVTSTAIAVDDSSSHGLKRRRLTDKRLRFAFEPGIPHGRYELHVESSRGHLKTQPKTVYVVPARGCVADEQAEAVCLKKGADFSYGALRDTHCSGMEPLQRPEAALDPCACNDMVWVAERRRKCENVP